MSRRDDYKYPLEYVPQQSGGVFQYQVQSGYGNKPPTGSNPLSPQGPSSQKYAPYGSTGPSEGTRTSSAYGASSFKPGASSGYLYKPPSPSSTTNSSSYGRHRPHSPDRHYPSGGSHGHYGDAHKNPQDHSSSASHGYLPSDNHHYPPPHHHHHAASFSHSPLDHPPVSPDGRHHSVPYPGDGPLSPLYPPDTPDTSRDRYYDHPDRDRDERRRLQELERKERESGIEYERELERERERDRNKMRDWERERDLKDLERRERESALDYERDKDRDRTRLLELERRERESGLDYEREKMREREHRDRELREKEKEKEPVSAYDRDRYRYRDRDADRNKNRDHEYDREVDRTRRDKDIAIEHELARERDRQRSWKDKEKKDHEKDRDDRDVRDRAYPRERSHERSHSHSQSRDRSHERGGDRDRDRAAKDRGLDMNFKSSASVSFSSSKDKEKEKDKDKHKEQKKQDRKEKKQVKKDKRESELAWSSDGRSDTESEGDSEDSASRRRNRRQDKHDRHDRYDHNDRHDKHDRHDRHDKHDPRHSTGSFHSASDRPSDSGARYGKRPVSPSSSVSGGSGHHRREESLAIPTKSKKDRRPSVGAIITDVDRLNIRQHHGGSFSASSPPSPGYLGRESSYRDLSPLPSPTLGPSDRDRSFNFSVAGSASLGAPNHSSGAWPSLSSGAPAYLKPALVKKHADARYDPSEHAVALYKALKGHSADPAAIIKILPTLSGSQILQLRVEYKKVHHVPNVNLAKHIKAQLPGNFKLVAWMTASGPWETEGYWSIFSNQKTSTRYELLIEALLGKTNDEILDIKEAFKDSRYNNSLETAIKKELAADPKTGERFKSMILLQLEAKNMEEWDTVYLDKVREDVEDLHKALTKKPKPDTQLVIEIVIQANTTHLRETMKLYKKVHEADLARLIAKQIPGLVGEGLIHILNGILNKPARDAKLLEMSMKGAGTRDDLLISRMIRIHWDPDYMQAVKEAYKEKFGRTLKDRIIGDTSGDYQTFLVAMLAVGSSSTKK